jgi:hypothetical protein
VRPVIVGVRLLIGRDALGSANVTDTSNQASSLDASVPNVARMYDYWLGGKDNFAVDREAAERSVHAVPQLPWFARENRLFLGAR